MKKLLLLLLLIPTIISAETFEKLNYEIDDKYQITEEKSLDATEYITYSNENNSLVIQVLKTKTEKKVTINKEFFDEFVKGYVEGTNNEAVILTKAIKDVNGYKTIYLRALQYDSVYSDSYTILNDYYSYSIIVTSLDENELKNEDIENLLDSISFTKTKINMQNIISVIISIIAALISVLTIVNLKIKNEKIGVWVIIGTIYSVLLALGFNQTLAYDFTSGTIEYNIGTIIGYNLVSTIIIILLIKKNLKKN